MGREMGLRLLAAGHALTVCNRTPEKARPLLDAGAVLAATPRDAVAGARFVLSMVGDDDDSRKVWLGAKGVINGEVTRKASAVECSTLSPTWVMRLQDELTAAGMKFADCPVTGGPDGARAGTLTVLAGGAHDVIDELRPLLSAFARDVIHFGPTGSGTRYKLIANLLGAVEAAGVAEALLMAEHAGLDLAKVADALKGSAVSGRHVNYLIERILSGNHDDIYFLTRLRHKDATYALDLARELQLELPTSTAAAGLFRRAVDQGLGGKNSSVIIEMLREATPAPQRNRKN
jgi:3-hydroxyisobutyrate dehydrogenase